MPGYLVHPNCEKRPLSAVEVTVRKLLVVSSFHMKSDGFPVLCWFGHNSVPMRLDNKDWLTRSKSQLTSVLLYWTKTEYPTQAHQTNGSNQDCAHSSSTSSSRETTMTSSTITTRNTSTCEQWRPQRRGTVADSRGGGVTLPGEKASLPACGTAGTALGCSLRRPPELYFQAASYAE